VCPRPIKLLLDFDGDDPLAALCLRVVFGSQGPADLSTPEGLDQVLRDADPVLVHGARTHNVRFSRHFPHASS
jgi:hypothetical protein